MKDWLFSDLKQSIYLANSKALLEDLGFKDFKTDHPQANLFYGSYFKTLAKLCSIPVITIMVDFLLVLAWGLVVGLCSSKTPLFFINLISEDLGDFLTLVFFVGFIGILYFGAMYIILSRHVWRLLCWNMFFAQN